MITTNNIAPSVCPNHSNASGTQQTLGSVCKPSASTPIVSSTNFEDAVSNPSGKPICQSDKISKQQTPQRYCGCLKQRPVAESAREIFNHAPRRGQQNRRPDLCPHDRAPDRDQRNEEQNRKQRSSHICAGVAFGM